MKVLTFVVFCFCVKHSLADKALSPCNNFKTCGACIGYPGDTCVWCSEPNITQRCQSKRSHEKGWCKGSPYEPKLLTPVLTRDESFRSASHNSSAVQFRPQQMTAKLRPGYVLNFEMSFKHADDFPLDVYYIMDYSYTMKTHVKTLKTQSHKIKTQLRQFTNNVWFGIGSFIEKPDYPFVGDGQQSYAFRNNLKLTSDIKLFDDVLSQETEYSNYDLPEAGLDALMQAMACNKEIGWRPNANRIIVLCTDATYHSAGDGKAVLAYKPNDMTCHLNGEGYYDQSLIQDYPSVSQINKLAKDGKFKIIFATLQKVKQEYEYLKEQIYGAKHAILTENNIFDIIKEVYLESRRHIIMKYKFPHFVELTLQPDCRHENKTPDCEIGHKQVFKMNATLNVTSCPQPADYHQILEVGPLDGGLEDKLKIDLDIVCQCDCEKDKTKKPNAPECTNSGTLQCGVCACNKDRYGDVCQCDGSLTSTTDLEKCKKVNDTKYCSGKGSCSCGTCFCKAGYSGDFCEFDDNSCKKKDNRLCSGNGRCTLGACACDTEWEGEDCGCSTRSENCYAPYSKEICSGKGVCKCNQCVCGKIEGKQETYSGVFCDDCEECASKRCKELEGYVRCNYVSNQTHCDEQYSQASSTEVKMMNKTVINTSKWPPNAKWCWAELDNKKSIVFIHYYDKNDNIFRIIIQKEAEVPPKANIWLPVGIAIGTVLLIGLLTLIVWKLLVDAMDAREYNKFMEQAKSEGFDVTECNPIYQPASVNFANPTYNVVDNALVDKHD